MKNEAKTLGQSICVSRKFLQAIHKDTLAVVRAIDTVMGGEKWYPTEKNRIADNLSNGSDAECWIIDALYRIYVPAMNGDGADKLISVHIEFNPPECFDEPVCLGMVGLFPQKMAGKSIWDVWEGSESKRLMQNLCGLEMPQPIAKTALQKGLMPGASSGTAFLCKLCDLIDVPAVEKRFAGPLLECARNL